MLLSRKNFYDVAILAIAVSITHSCKGQDASFSAQSGDGEVVVFVEPNVATHSPSPNPGFVRDKSETFPLVWNKPGQVDLIWVVDNSTSMISEAANVRSNLDNFVTSLSNTTDLRMFLISNSTSTPTPVSPITTGVDLSAAALATGHMQINTEVGSKNSLSLATATLCDASLTTRSKVCDVPYVYAGNAYYHDLDSSIPGSLVGHIRAASSKVFVFVTDDDAALFKARQFQDAIGQLPGFESYTVFAYRFPESVQSTPSCSGQYGSEYDVLTRSTGGKSFSICDTDWSKNFEELKKSVDSIANSSFELNAKNVLRVLEVKIGEKVLGVNDWSLSRGSVIVDSSTIPEAASEIKITYRYATTLQ